jgi:hypothetical protein
MWVYNVNNILVCRSNSKIGSSIDEYKRFEYCSCEESFAGKKSLINIVATYIELAITFQYL